MRTNKGPVRKHLYKNRVYFILVFTAFITIVSAAYGSSTLIDSDTEGQNSFPNTQQVLEDQKQAAGAEDQQTAGTEANELEKILLLGVDNREPEVPETATLLVSQFNPDNGEVKMASILADSYVEIAGHQDNKLRTVYSLGGIELLRETLQENFGLSIDYYAAVDFEQFKELTDIIAPEGLKVDIAQPMSYKDTAGAVEIELEEGEQLLNGTKVLDYLRYREECPGDFGRVSRQQEILQLFHEKLINADTLNEAPKIIGTLRSHVETDIPTGKMIAMGKDFLQNDNAHTQKLTIPEKENAKEESYSHTGEVIQSDDNENRLALENFFESSSGTE